MRERTAPPTALYWNDLSETGSARGKARIWERGSKEVVSL